MTFEEARRWWMERLSPSEAADFMDKVAGFTPTVIAGRLVEHEYLRLIEELARLTENVNYDADQDIDKYSYVKELEDLEAENEKLMAEIERLEKDLFIVRKESLE